MKPHPGPRIEKIPVKGAAGLIFVFGVMFIFWVGVPPVRGFVILGAVGGLAAFAALRWWRKYAQHSANHQPLFSRSPNSVSGTDQAGRSTQSRTRD